MKTLRKLLIVLVLIFGIALASCDNKKVEGSLTINYGLGIESKKVTASEYSKDLLTVEKTGYNFLGWYLDTNYSSVYVTEDTISGDVTIYAKWETIKYDINYHLNGGTNNSNNPAKYTIEDKVSLLNATRDGYTFEGWYTEESLTNKIAEIAKGSTGNKDFYAKWELRTPTEDVTITYKVDNRILKSLSALDSEAYVLPTAPTKTGYEFVGWYVGDEEFDPTVVPTESITVVGRYKKETYKVSYYYSFGHNQIAFILGSETVEYNSKALGIENDVTVEGREFKGWYLDDQYKTQFDIANTPIKKDIDLFGKYEAIEYSITYNLDGGTNASTNPSKYTFEDEVVLARPSKNGYTFAGWMLETGAPITKIEKGTTGPIVLIATWTQDVLVSFVVDNETVKTVNITNGEQVTLPSNPSKTGYDFDGWYVGENEFNAQQTFTESVTVTAKFTVQKFDVKFYVGTELVDTKQADYNSPTNALPNNPTKTGCDFKGWYLEDNTAFDAKNTLITKATNVYAKFDVIEYDITYDLNGGTNNANNPAKYTVEDEVTFANPTRAGYTFTGWMQETGAPITKIEKGTTGPVTVVASCK